MVGFNRLPALVSLFGLALVLGSGLFAGTASAAAVDLQWQWRPGEDPTCRYWPQSGNVQWNLTLAMNGTDSSLIPTPTYVFIDDASIQGPRADGWNFILTAGNSATEPPSFSDADSNTFVSGNASYSPIQPTVSMDLALYSGTHVPPAPPANITVFLLPKIESENKTWTFNLTARTHRSSVTPDIVRRISLCVVIPAKPRFDMGNKTDVIQAAADSNVTVDFWLKNVGNTPDLYNCSVRVPRDDWTWLFVTVLNPGNYTNTVNLSQNITIKVRVYVPPTAKARENSTVSLECHSFKARQLGEDPFVYPPYTRIEVIQYYYVCGEIVGESTKGGVPGDQLAFDFRVSNKGNGPDQGVASIVSGDLSWEALLSPDTFDLPAFGDPNDEQLGQFLVTIPIATRILTYDYHVNISSVVPLTPTCTLRFHVKVNQVYIPFVTQPAGQTGVPNQEVNFEFTVRNDGNGLDQLIIDIINASDWRVFLDPPILRRLYDVYQESTYRATVIVPKDLTKAQVGVYNQSIRVSSEYASLDLGASIFVQINLSVVILPRVSCSFDPAVTEKEMNPFQFPGGVAEANFIPGLNNTGNGGETFFISSTGLPEINVTMSPTTLTTAILERKAVLVTLKVPSIVAAGEYNIKVVARAQSNSSVTCNATYHLTIFHLDGELKGPVSLFVQNPERPEDPVESPVTSPEVEQVETFFVRFRVTVSNPGDRAVAAGTAVVRIFDMLDCRDRTPIGATENTCGSRQIDEISLTNNLIVGGTVNIPFTYIAPEYLCFDEDICHGESPPYNSHRIRFSLNMSFENTTANNHLEVVINVLPKTVLPPVIPPPPPPFVEIGLAVAAVGGVVFGFWWRFIRVAKVDEELYASIYGGQGAPAAQTQTVDQYFATQSEQPPPGTPPPYQGMTDEQLEEARRMYGDSYGRK